MITRAESTIQILAAKKSKGLTFEAIAAAVGRHQVWVTAALMGQATMSADEATAAARVLGLGPEVAEALQEMPMKGSLDSTVPVDPLIYRFHEITQVYGTTIKALIHEMFGDGIMSAIDFEMDIQKIEDPKGDRVVVTYNGKFLPYKLDFIHLSQFASQLIGSETHVLFVLKGWPCSPCRSPLAVPLGSLHRCFLVLCGSMSKSF